MQTGVADGTGNAGSPETSDPPRSEVPDWPTVLPSPPKAHGRTLMADSPQLPTLALIALAAEDWYETVDFYHDLLGLPLIERDESRSRARLQAGPGLVLEVVSGGYGSEEPKTPRENPVSLCIRVHDLPRRTFELEQRGVWLLREPTDGPLSLLDPEGNRVYLYDTDELPYIPDGWETTP